MKVALVYDRVNKFGGAERVLLALHRIWPDAPLFSAVYDPKGATWADVFRVHPSFLNRVPFAQKHHELYPWLTPLAFESFSFDQYAVVISITSAEAKNIMTKPGTLHICYCLTPTRYLWSGNSQYVQDPGFGPINALASFFLTRMTPLLKQWDYIAAQRPDYYIAISQHVASRIKKYYQRAVTNVIYPPVDTQKFIPKKNRADGKYFLVVSRFVPYKRLDVIIDAFNMLKWPLVIIGSGSEEISLKAKAQDTITFVDVHLTDDALVNYYQRCSALVFAGDEDFGLVAVEAQACGKPVICYRNSGMAETVIEGKTGILFDEQTKESLIDALQRFHKGWYDIDLCRQSAARFSDKRFASEMEKIVTQLYNKHI